MVRAVQKKCVIALLHVPKVSWSHRSKQEEENNAGGYKAGNLSENCSKLSVSPCPITPRSGAMGRGDGRCQVLSLLEGLLKRLLCQRTVAGER